LQAAATDANAQLVVVDQRSCCTAGQIKDTIQSCTYMDSIPASRAQVLGRAFNILDLV